MPGTFYKIFGSALCGFLLFIPVGIAYLIARTIQKRVQKRKDETESGTQVV
jgi:hypothetical protein